MMRRSLNSFFIVYISFSLWSCSQVIGPSNDRIKGVFLSEKTATSANGDPCYYLVQFFEDGTLIHSGLCSASVEDNWESISQWFHRDSEKDLARGKYVLTGNTISFKVSAYFSELNHSVALSYEGEYSEDSMVLSLYSETTGEEWLGMQWSRLDLID